MWFPNEIFTHIKDYMLNYKYVFSRKILPLIVWEKASRIVNIKPVWGRVCLNENMYEIRYNVPRYSINRISEKKMNKLGLTHHGQERSKKDEKVYMYLRNSKEFLSLEGYKQSRYYDKKKVILGYVY